MPPRIEVPREYNAAYDLIEARYPDEGHVDWGRRVVLPRRRAQWDFLVVRRAEVPLIEAAAEGEAVREIGEYVILRRIPGRTGAPVLEERAGME